MFVNYQNINLPTDDEAIYYNETSGIEVLKNGNQTESIIIDKWYKVPLTPQGQENTLRIATGLSWLVNWILLFCKIAVVLVSNSKAVSFLVVSYLDS